MLDYLVIYSLSEGESGSKHARNSVYRKIIATIKNLYHIQCQSIEALS